MFIIYVRILFSVFIYLNFKMRVKADLLITQGNSLPTS